MTRQRGSRRARMPWVGEEGAGEGGSGSGPPGKVGPVVQVISRLILGFDFPIGCLTGKLFKELELLSGNAVSEAVLALVAVVKALTMPPPSARLQS